MSVSLTGGFEITDFWSSVREHLLKMLKEADQDKWGVNIGPLGASQREQVELEEATDWVFKTDPKKKVMFVYVPLTERPKGSKKIARMIWEQIDMVEQGGEDDGDSGDGL